MTPAVQHVSQQITAIEREGQGHARALAHLVRRVSEMRAAVEQQVESWMRVQETIGRAVQSLQALEARILHLR